MEKIKVLHVIIDMGDGGAQRIILNYMKDFVNFSEFDCQVLALSDRKSELYIEEIKNMKFKIDFLNTKSSKKGILKKFDFLFRTEKEVTNYLKQNDFSIVHVHLAGTLIYTLKAISKFKIPLKFYTLHSNPSRFKGLRLKFLRIAFKKLNFIPICVTNEQAKLAKEYYKFSKFEVIHNGIDFEKIKVKIITRKKARECLDLNDNVFVVCAVGRLEKIKCYDFLIEIFSKLLVKKENSILVIAGVGPEMDSLKALANSLGILDRVRFLGNIENVVQLYCASDVLAVTSKSESSSLVLLEAQTCNLRAVISAGVPQESIITDKVQKMSKNASISEWVLALLDENYLGQHEYGFADYEVHEMSKKLKDIYLKYLKEYVSKK